MMNASELPADDGDPFLICFVRGGLDADATGEFARAGEMTWRRGAGESREEFRARAEREARAANEARLIFGGLPG